MYNPNELFGWPNTQGTMWLRAVCFIWVLNSLEHVDANGNDPIERKEEHITEEASLQGQEPADFKWQTLLLQEEAGTYTVGLI